jgi:hypothetical protein
VIELRAIFSQLVNYQVDPKAFAPLINALRSSSIGGHLESIQANPVKVSFGETWLYASLARLDIMDDYVIFRRANGLVVLFDIFDIWLEMLIVVSSQNLEGQSLVEKLNQYISLIEQGYTLDQGLYSEFERAVQFLLPDLVGVK